MGTEAMTLAEEFLQLARQKAVLRFGEFTLKSGRTSPYFFNAGLFDDGQSLSALGELYARAIHGSGIDFDMLYGPAYKGIPIATAIAIAYARLYGRNLPVCFNRKEAKDHGEGGQLIGAPLRGQVLIVDDVISAGTSVRESFAIIENNGASVAGVSVALDRQEKGQASEGSAIDEIRQQHGIPVVSIATLDDLLHWLQRQDSVHASAIQTYREHYGASSH